MKCEGLEYNKFLMSGVNDFNNNIRIKINQSKTSYLFSQHVKPSSTFFSSTSLEFCWLFLYYNLTFLAIWECIEMQFIS